MNEIADRCGEAGAAAGIEPKPRTEPSPEPHGPGAREDYIDKVFRRGLLRRASFRRPPGA